jgi:hypothetical protein
MEINDVQSHPLRITERDELKEESLDAWFKSFQGLDLHLRVSLPVVPSLLHYDLLR